MKLRRRQLDQLSDIASDVGLVALASVVLPAVLDKFDPIEVGLGLLATILFWSISLWLKK
jgi:hypothetical protein